MVPEYIISSIYLPCIDDIFGLVIFRNFYGRQRSKARRTYNVSRTLGGLPLFERRPITCAGHKDGLRSRIRVREAEEERANVKPLAGEVHTSTLHKPAFLSQCIAVYFYILCVVHDTGEGCRGRAHHAHVCCDHCPTEMSTNLQRVQQADARTA